MSNGLNQEDVAGHINPIVLLNESDKSNAPASPVARSASSVQLSTAELPGQIYPVRTDSIRRSFSENLFQNGSTTVLRRSSTQSKSKANARPVIKRAASSKHIINRSPSNADKVIPQFSIGSDQPKRQPPRGQHARQHSHGKERPAAKRSVSGSFSKFTRRSWVAPSRSPSPASSKRRPSIESVTTTGSSGDLKEAISVTQPLTESESTVNPVAAEEGQSVRRNSLLRRKSGRPLSSLISKRASSDAPSVPPIPKSYSTDRLPSLKHQVSNLSEPPPLPRSTSHEKLSALGKENLRKKDELWGAFRSLDGDYHKFSSRPSTTKTAVVRSSLLPFLRNYADHPSISRLRAEDLDRRTVILNKWWTGLLEMLNGRYGESVSGNDRPAVLEAATALMLRPEWTLAAPTLPSRSTKGPRMALKSRSTTSLGSTMSDFLVDSVFHNVKNIFTQNLLAQMAYVVQKMSMRSVAASVVTFCGKAVAYAFFYCEGVAAILVRLWGLTSDTLQRVLSEYGVSRVDSLCTATDRLCATFPTCLHPLALRSLPSMIKYLRNRPHLPIATANIPWHGPWVSRWAGKDTDLFFVFTKHYTDLLCQLIPDDMSFEEQIAAPGWALVQAQLMTVMQSTIQRSLSPLTSDHTNGSSSVTFEDLLADANATATMIPLPTNSMTRSMAENRLIMLLRDCLANANLGTNKAQRVFADVYDRVLKATARRISLFDHNACFTLCDFLEEAIVILTRYYQSAHPARSAFDWSFWVEVCQQMLQSQNTMTEVRLCAFLFSMWGTLARDQNTRRNLCLGWLLSKDVFQAQFNHWCPMVRAFYMRLLIWKVARPNSQGSEVDRMIVDALSKRLDEVWLQFRVDCDAAQTRGLAMPSTTPCSPAPSRQLLIIRDDIQPAPSGMFLSFDGILSSANKGSNPYEKHSSRNPHIMSNASRSTTNSEQPSSLSITGKKKWEFFKSIMPFSGSGVERKSSSKPPGSKRVVSLSPARTQEGSSHGSGDSSPDIEPLQSTGKQLARYQSLSFKFSLEWVHKDNHSTSRERRLSRPRLPPLAAPYAEAKDPQIETQTAWETFEQCRPGPSKYSGRALAEWASLVLECQNFLERRKAEGVPTYEMVEIPSLSVEPFRRT